MSRRRAERSRGVWGAAERARLLSREWGERAAGDGEGRGFWRRRAALFAERPLMKSLFVLLRASRGWVHIEFAYLTLEIVGFPLPI